MAEEQGVVKFYKPDQGFGFFLRDQGRDVFFHIKQGVEFRDRGGLQPVKELYSGPPLVPGDKVVFEVTETEKGFQAIWWAREESRPMALTSIARRPEFAFVKKTGSRPTSLESPDQVRKITLWRGKDLLDLRQRFPVSTFPEGKRNGEEFYFCRLADGKWFVCDDPR